MAHIPACSVIVVATLCGAVGAAQSSTPVPAPQPAQAAVPGGASVAPSGEPTTSAASGSVPPEGRSAGDVLPAEAPTSTGQELDRTSIGQDDPENFWDRPLVNLNSAAKNFEVDTGLKIGMAFTMLLQQATGGPGDRTAAGGDLDLMMRWTALGRGTKNTGVVVFNTEYRFQIGDITPSALAGQIDAGTATTNGFSEREVVVKELYWAQTLMDGVVRFGVGRADPENLTTAHKMQSANTFFQHKAFSGNPAVAFPGSGPAAAIGLTPSSEWFIGAGAINAYSTTTTMQIESLFDEWDLFAFVEAGWTPTFDGLGAGRYRVAYWHIDAQDRGSTDKPEDSGINFIADQELGEQFSAFFRYGHSEADMTGVQNLITGGVGYKGLSAGGFTGLAAGYIDYSDATRQNETVFELFHRWQLTPQMQFTLGAEMICDPADSPDSNTVGVFNARLRLTF